MDDRLPDTAPVADHEGQPVVDPTALVEMPDLSKISAKKDLDQIARENTRASFHWNRELGELRSKGVSEDDPKVLLAIKRVRELSRRKKLISEKKLQLEEALNPVPIEAINNDSVKGLNENRSRVIAILRDTAERLEPLMREATRLSDRAKVAELRVLQRAYMSALNLLENSTKPLKGSE